MDTIIDATVIQDKLLALLGADPLILAAFPNLVDPDTETVTIKPDNPLKIDAATGLDLCIFPMMEDSDDATLGGLDGGLSNTTVTFGVIVWMYEKTYNPADLARLVQITSRVRIALMRYRAAEADAPYSGQLFYTSAFRRTGQGVTGYYRNPGAYRRSLTFLDVSTQQPFI